MIVNNWLVVKTSKPKKPVLAVITDKERRLIEQNQAEARRLSGLKTNIFTANRFGPLMFALSFGVIGVYFAVMGFAATPATAGRTASLSIEPAARSIKKGQTVAVRVWSDSMDQPIASVQAGLVYPADKFDFVAVDASQSAFVTEDATELETGTVTVRRSAAATEAAMLTGRQLVAKVTFRAKADTTTGSADMWFSADSRLLRASDRTNILERTDGSRYYISVIAP